MIDIAVTTVAAYRDVSFLNEQTRPLRESFARMAAPPNLPWLWMTQVGQPWRNFYENKVVRFLDDLKKGSPWNSRPRPKCLLYCDAADTLLLRDPRLAVDVLEYYGKPIVLGAETVCWPWPRRHGPRFPPQPSGLRYPQAGVWVGEYEAVVAELEAIKQMVLQDQEHYSEGQFGFHVEDQCCWTERALHSDLIALDVEARLVANMNSAPADQFVLLDRGVFCPVTNQAPVVLHWAGGKGNKQLLRGYAQRIGEKETTL